MLGLLIGSGPFGGAAARGMPIAATSQGPAVTQERFAVDLGDVQTEAELTYPAAGHGPFPTVLPIGGSGPYDMDFTVVGFGTGEVRSAIFSDIAEFLSARGYAVVRYDKRYVTRPNDPVEAQTYYQNFTLPMLLADATAVYHAARDRPPVDPARIVLYGWSEGATIATQLAAQRSEVAGLVLQGAPDGLFRDVFRYQTRVLVVNFLTDAADADRDGVIVFDELLVAYERHPGTVANFGFLLAFEPSSTPSAPKLNAKIDANGDGALAIDGEIVPFVDDFFANFDRWSATGGSPYGLQYAIDAQLPPIVDALGQVEGPVLMLHGENDANVPPEASDRIDAALTAAGHRDHTLRRYPGLGHSLGPARTVVDDAFAPIAERPLTDLVGWLDRRVGRTPIPAPPDIRRG